MGIFKKSSNETSSIVKYVDKKTRLLRAKYDYAQNNQHKHLFSKREVNTPGIDPRCKVCGMPLSELTMKRKLDAVSERFKAAKEVALNRS